MTLLNYTLLKQTLLKYFNLYTLLKQTLLKYFAKLDFTKLGDFETKDRALLQERYTVTIY